MYLKKFLNQPNAVGSVLIALLFSAGVLFAFGFNGFNVQNVADENGTDIFTAISSKVCGSDLDCSCGAGGCDVKNCRPEDCTPRTCPSGCREPGETCPCTAKCNTYDCQGGCPVSPASPY